MLIELLFVLSEEVEDLVAGALGLVVGVVGLVADVVGLVGGVVGCPVMVVVG